MQSVFNKAIPIVWHGAQRVNTNSGTYSSLSESDFALIAPQLDANKADIGWIRIGATVASGILMAGIWFWKIAPDDKSPGKLLVEPVEDVLTTFLQPATSMADLSKDVGFAVQVPDLKSMGATLKNVGESDFAGHRAAVMQFEQSGYVFLMYSVHDTGNLLPQMRHVNGSHRPFFVTSSGSVSVVAWVDPHTGYRAIAAKSTEQDLLSLASKISEVC